MVSYHTDPRNEVFEIKMFCVHWVSYELRNYYVHKMQKVLFGNLNNKTFQSQRSEYNSYFLNSLLLKVRTPTFNLGDATCRIIIPQCYSLQVHVCWKAHFILHINMIRKCSFKMPMCVIRFSFDISGIIIT